MPAAGACSAREVRATGRQMKTLARERDTAELLRRLRRVRPDSGRRWGKMTAHQMMCHLTDCCRMALGEYPVKDVSSLPKRTLVKWIALYAPLRWPTELETTPETNQHVGGTCPTDFSADLTVLEAQMERL